MTAKWAGFGEDNVTLMGALRAAVLAGAIGDGLAEVQARVHTGRVDVEVSSVETHLAAGSGLWWQNQR